MTLQIPLNDLDFKHFKNQHPTQNNKDDFEFEQNLLSNIQNAISRLKHSYTATADNLVDEILVTLSEQQVNDALDNFIVANVGLLLGLRLELHDDMIRLYCKADLLGMYLSVVSDFRLTCARLDRHTQRFVFEQIAPTTILSLHTKSWYQAPAIKFAIDAYRVILKKDPLPFLLSLSPKLKGEPFIRYKGNFIYLDIGRWLPDNIIGYLKKVQINHGIVKKEQLILKAEPNFADIFSLGDPNSPVITEKDNPNNSDEED